MNTPIGTMAKPKLDLNKSFGALLIGVVFSAALFGVTCTQVFYYFQNYSRDNWIIKATVVLLLVMEALHSVFGVHAIYFYVILNYLNPSALTIPTWSARMTQAITAAITFVVQLFYLRRVYFLSRKNIALVIVISILAAARIATSIGMTVEFFKLKLLTQFGGSSGFAHLGIANLALCVATDAAIAISLTYYLHTSRSGIEKTDSLINKLMVYTINNGIMTSVLNIIVLGFLKDANSHNSVFFGIYQVVANLYTNSMLATLNSRRSLSQDDRVTMNTFQVAAGIGGTTSGTGTSSGEEIGPMEFNKNKNPLLTLTTMRDVRSVA